MSKSVVRIPTGTINHGFQNGEWGKTTSTTANNITQRVRRLIPMNLTVLGKECSPQ